VSSVSIKLPMVRIQIRAPPPPEHPRRSGALILDLHDVVLSTGSTTSKKPAVSFAAADGPPPSVKLVSTECRRIVLGCSPFDKGEASAFVSIGPLSASQDPSGVTQTSSGPIGDAVPEPLRPRIAVTQSDCSDRAQASEPMTPSPPTLVVNVDIPSLHIQLSKAVFDDLQYWVDDASQLSERTFGNGGAEIDSRDTSLIGSRFFARSKRSDSDGGSGQNSHQQPGSRTAVKVAVSEGRGAPSSYKCLLTLPLSVNQAHAPLLARERLRHSETVRYICFGFGQLSRPETREGAFPQPWELVWPASITLN
jgi:autophagy-related protein 2